MVIIKDRGQIAEDQRNRQEKLAALEYREPEVHHYDASRREMTPIEFAEHVLAAEGVMYRHHGHWFIDGKYATPSLKVEHASRVLVRMKLRPVELWGRS